MSKYDEDNVLQLLINEKLVGGEETYKFPIPHGISLRSVYCSKTGQHWADRTDNEMQMIWDTIKDNSATSQFAAFLAGACSSQWIKTDGNSLNRLMKTDPIGYFCYNAALACPWDTRGSLESFLEYRVHQVQLYKFLENISWDIIRDCNEEWRTFHTVIKTNRMRQWNITLATLATPNIFENLRNIMRSHIEQAQAAETQFQTAIIQKRYHDLAAKFGPGHSNIASQHESYTALNLHNLEILNSLWGMDIPVADYAEYTKELDYKERRKSNRVFVGHADAKPIPSAGFKLSFGKKKGS